MITDAHLAEIKEVFGDGFDCRVDASVDILKSSINFFYEQRITIPRKDISRLANLGSGNVSSGIAKMIIEKVGESKLFGFAKSEAIVKLEKELEDTEAKLDDTNDKLASCKIKLTEVEKYKTYYELEKDLREAGAMYIEKGASV